MLDCLATRSQDLVISSAVERDLLQEPVMSESFSTSNEYVILRMRAVVNDAIVRIQRDEKRMASVVYALGVPLGRLRASQEIFGCESLFNQGD